MLSECRGEFAMNVCVCLCVSVSVSVHSQVCVASCFLSSFSDGQCSIMTERFVVLVSVYWRLTGDTWDCCG